MIDLRAARSEPDRFRAALVRKGAAEAFDALLEADRHWLELVPLRLTLLLRFKVDVVSGQLKAPPKVVANCPE